VVLVDQIFAVGFIGALLLARGLATQLFGEAKTMQ
jgi:hypothetical protein